MAKASWSTTAMALVMKETESKTKLVPMLRMAETTNTMRKTRTSR